MMKKKQTLVLSIGISLFLLLGIVGLKFHNRIYAWTLGDVQSLYAQAESLYQQKEYEEAKKLYAKLAGIDSASRCQYVLGDMYFQGQGGEKDYDKARRLFIQAAEGGNADALEAVAEYYPKYVNSDGVQNGLEEVLNTQEVIAVEYYSLDGKRLAEPVEGINIRRTIYRGGKVYSDLIQKK